MIVGSDTSKSLSPSARARRGVSCRIPSHPVRWVGGTTFRWLNQLSPMTPRIHLHAAHRPPAKLSRQSRVRFQ